MGGEQLAELFVDIRENLNPLKGGLSRGLGLVKNFGLAAAAAATAGMAAAAGAIAGSIPLIAMGADLNEMRSKFTAVFQEVEGEAREFAVAFAAGVGRSQIGLETMLADMQSLMVPLGFARDEASQLSQTLVRLAVDLGSFNNMTDDEALQKLRSGILGETEPLKSLGVVINDVTLSAKLMQMGLAKNAQEATEQQKVMARMAIILESTKDAQGDAARTSDSLSNRWKGLTGSVFDLASSFGQSLVPGATAVVEALQGVAAWAADNMVLFTTWGEAIGQSAATAVQGFLPLVQWVMTLGQTILVLGNYSTSVFGTIGGQLNGLIPSLSTIQNWIEGIAFGLMNWDLVVSSLGLTFAETFTNAWGRVSNFFKNAGELVTWFGNNWKDVIFTAVDGAMTAFINLGKNIQTIFFAIIKSIRSGSLEPLTRAMKEELLSLNDGAVSTIKEGPKFSEFKPVDMTDQWAELDDQWETRLTQWNTMMAQEAPLMGATLGAGLAAGVGNVDFSSLIKLDPKQFDLSGKGKKGSKSDKSGDKVSLSSAYDKVQSAALGKDKQLDELKKIAKSTDIIAKKKEQKNDGPGMPLFAD